MILPTADLASQRFREHEGVEGQQQFVVLGELVEEDEADGNELGRPCPGLRRARARRRGDRSRQQKTRPEERRSLELWQTRGPGSFRLRSAESGLRNVEVRADSSRLFLG